MFNFGGVACGPESGGTWDEIRRGMPVKLLVASDSGAEGCDGRLDGLGLGALGGGGVPALAPLEPAEASIAGEAEPPADPAGRCHQRACDVDAPGEHVTGSHRTGTGCG